jgi:hypothetical protein
VSEASPVISIWYKAWRASSLPLRLVPMMKERLHPIIG